MWGGSGVGFLVQSSGFEEEAYKGVACWVLGSGFCVLGSGFIVEG